MNPLRALRGVLPAVFFLAALPAQETSAKQEIQPTNNPFLFKFEHEGVTHHLFGTIHLPDPRVTTLSKAVNDARKAADAVVLEVDPKEMQDPSAVMKLMNMGGKPLKEVIGDDNYKRFETWCQKSQMPAAAIGRMKPWVIASMIALGDDFAAAQSQALDMVLGAEAQVQGKQVMALETLDLQAKAMDSMGEKIHRMMVVQALDIFFAEDDEENPIEELIQAYLKGDSREFEQISNKGFDDKVALAKFNKVLLTDRNVGMVEGIEKALEEKSNRALFVAVGAAHLQGKGGLVELLRKKGFKVERVNGKGETVPDHPKKAAATSQPARKAG